MSDFPAHASPAFPPHSSPRPGLHERAVSDFHLHHGTNDGTDAGEGAPPPLMGLSLTPPATPNSLQQSLQPPSDPATMSLLDTPSSLLDDGLQPEQPTPKLLPVLPTVTCEVRARIPTTHGQEMWLHLYHNNADEKEHLAIVFGPHIRSRSLDAHVPGETEKDRMIRGAYVGTLFPGRTSSRLQQIRREAGVGTTVPSQARRRGSADSAESDEGADGHKQTAREGASVEMTDAAHYHWLAPPLVRIHSECYTGETVWSARCDCGEQLDEAARLMSLPQTPNTNSPSAGGVIIYLRQEGRGIGLLSKLKAYNLQDLGHDTMQANLLLRHPADARSYGLATAMLMDLGLGGETGIRLLTNNPEKVRAVEGPNREVRVAERVAMIPLAWSSGGKEGVQGPEVEKYISTKIEKFKHMFSS